MEEVKLKAGIQLAMSTSSLCNAYMQDSAPWDLSKTQPERCAQVMNTAC